MKRLIAVNGIKVEQGLCTVAFRIWPKFNNMKIAEAGKEVTHDVLYKLLDTAEKVQDLDNMAGKICIIYMGNGITIDVWEKK